ncbi:MAG TPA: NRDE family protein, partial [Xanthomonadales bacterium]|nr:NRDE family protein [Xanthomonadales bacterium]
MCLILFSWQPEAERRLVVLANRDEFHARKSAQATFWTDKPHILAGRDLVAGGTWLGLSKCGRFAAITNFRQPGETLENARSRGELPVNFLTHSISA